MYILELPKRAEVGAGICSSVGCHENQVGEGEGFFHHKTIIPKVDA